jgi:hypothetical protein
MTRTIIFQNNVLIYFWLEAILTVIYLINRLPSDNQSFKNPLEILYDRKINLDHLKVFECTYFVHINRIDKLDFTLTHAIFLGYSFRKK